MELISDELLNKSETNEFGNTLKDIYEGRSYINFDEFKVIFHKFINIYMRTISNKYDSKNIECRIKTINGSDGLFKEENDKYVITYNINIILKLYYGDFSQLKIIFHELSHMNTKCQIKSNIINSTSATVYKEFLIRRYSNVIEKSDYLGVKKLSISDDFYDSNYSITVIETTAEIEGIKTMYKFLNYFGLKLSNFSNNKMKQILESNIEKTNNNIRDTKNITLLDGTIFNDYSMTVDDIIIFILKINPRLLDSPFIAIEYCKDECGNIRKKNTEELASSIFETINRETALYIMDLIKISKINGIKHIR